MALTHAFMTLQKTKYILRPNYDQQTKVHVNVFFCLEMRKLRLRKVPP